MRMRSATLARAVRSTMWTSLLSVLLSTPGGAVAAQLPARASGNQCAVCHIRLAWTHSGTTHVDEWVTSKHASYGVGCDKCHGGDPSATDGPAAHRGVLNSANPSSTVHWMALPSTCGRCHRPEVAAFALSAHDDLLSQGDARVPTCTSCHSAMAADVPAPAALERQCLHCHLNDPADRARIAKRQLEDFAALSAALKRAKLEIAGITDVDRQASLSARWSDADRALRGAAAGMHAFDLRRVDDRLTDVRAQVESLQRQLTSSK